MSIATLLRHVGVNVPRYVAVNGSVVLGRPTESSGLSLTPHRFHGGSLDDGAQATSPTDAWWDTDTERRQRDETVMAHYFPGFVVTPEDYGYVGILDSGRGRFEVLVRPRANGRCPHITPVSPKRLGRTEGKWWRRAPHLYDSGDLCVAAPTDWNPCLLYTS